MSISKVVDGTSGAARPAAVRLALGGLLAAAAGLSSLPAAAAPEAGAAQVIRDADTGQLRALTPEEHKALHDRQRALRKAGPDESRRGVVSGKADPVPQRLSNGARRVELTESSMSYSVMTRKADGSLEMRCVTGEQAADRLVQGGATVNLQEAGHEHH